MSPGNGLDCASCGCPLFNHILRPLFLAEEIPIPEDWGPLPSCTTKCPEPGKTSSFHYCDCPGYQVPVGLFTYAQVIELLQAARGTDAMRPGISTERNHKATGRPRGRPRKAERAGLASDDRRAP